MMPSRTSLPKPDRPIPRGTRHERDTARSRFARRTGTSPQRIAYLGDNREGHAGRTHDCPDGDRHRGATNAGESGATAKERRANTGIMRRSGAAKEGSDGSGVSTGFRAGTERLIVDFLAQLRACVLPDCEH